MKKIISYHVATLVILAFVIIFIIAVPMYQSEDVNQSSVVNESSDENENSYVNTYEVYKSKILELEKKLFDRKRTFIPKPSYKAKDVYPLYGTTKDHSQLFYIVYQIPEDELKTMTTEELCEYIVEYPLFITFAITNSNYTNDHENVFYTIKDVYNGLKEFVDRPNAAHMLVKKYLTLEVYTKDNYSDDVEPTDFFKMQVIEFLLAREDLFKQLTDEETEVFFYHMYENYNKREGNDVQKNSILSFNPVDESISQKYNDFKNKIEQYKAAE